MHRAHRERGQPMERLISLLGGFVFWYPLLMSFLWVAGSILYVRRREHEIDLDLENFQWPMISILIPCYNEEAIIEETITHIEKIAYTNREIIAVNDGSTDHTGEILHRLALKYDDLRVIDCQENRGKATALKLATIAAKAEYLICIDADAFLDPYAAHYLIYHFFHQGERLGAVTGNPRIRNRDTLLAKLQIVEYASIIGAIKRTQRVWGKIMTVSGVIAAFRKKALVDVGLWDHDIITDDIAISWKLQEKGWDIRYEPRALCWMLVPETLKGIWAQRIRWAQGGQEVVLRHWKIILDWRQRHMWPIFYEQWLTILWTQAWTITTVYHLIVAETLHELFIWLTFSSFALAFLCNIQLLSSLIIESKYDDVIKYFLWGAWYPFIYWLLNAMIVMFAFPRAIRNQAKGGYATWASPDRGFRKAS